MVHIDARHGRDGRTVKHLEGYQMRIELHWGGVFFLRVGGYAICMTGNDGLGGERRMPGDPWFKWGSFSEGQKEGEGACWLGSLRILWEYPTAARAISVG